MAISSKKLYFYNGSTKSINLYTDLTDIGNGQALRVKDNTNTLYAPLGTVGAPNSTELRVYKDSSYSVLSVADSLAITPTSLNVLASASSNTISVSSNTNWSAISNSAWVTITGTSSNTIFYSVQANPSTTSARTGTITVTAGALTKIYTIEQAIYPTLSIPASLIVPPEQSSGYISVLSNTGWTMTKDQYWLSLPPLGTYGTGSGDQSQQYQISYSNSSSSPRYATLTASAGGIITKNCNVTQQGISMSISPTTVTFPANSATTNTTRTLNITSNTPWRFFTNSSVMRVVGGALPNYNSIEGSAGNTTITLYTLQDNSTYNYNNYTATFEDRIWSTTQSPYKTVLSIVQEPVDYVSTNYNQSVPLPRTNIQHIEGMTVFASKSWSCTSNVSWITQYDTAWSGIANMSTGFLCNIRILSNGTGSTRTGAVTFQSGTASVTVTFQQSA